MHAAKIDFPMAWMNALRSPSRRGCERKLIKSCTLQSPGCGVWAVDLRSEAIVGFVKFSDAVQEIFAVQVLHGHRWPDILPEGEEHVADSFELPDAALEQVPERLRTKLRASKNTPVNYGAAASR